MKKKMTLWLTIGEWLTMYHRGLRMKSNNAEDNVFWWHTAFVIWRLTSKVIDGCLTVRATWALRDLPCKITSADRGNDDWFNCKALQVRITRVNEFTNDDDEDILIKNVSCAHYLLSFVVWVVFREYDLIRGWKSFLLVLLSGRSASPSLYLCCLVACTSRSDLFLKPSQSVLTRIERSCIC